MSTVALKKSKEESDEDHVEKEAGQQDAQKIRYSPGQIKIEKRSGKRTASVFCSLGGSKQRPIINKQLNRFDSHQSTLPSASPPSSILQVFL